MGKRIDFPVEKSKCTPGFCIVPEASADELHEYGLFKDGLRIDSGMFCSMERAKERLTDFYFETELEACELRDLDEEWYVSTAIRYRDRIKELKPSLKKSNIILDMSRIIYNRRPENWYTYIPFSHNGQEWEYRETAGGDWVEKVPCKKEK